MDDGVEMELKSLTTSDTWGCLSWKITTRQSTASNVVLCNKLQWITFVDFVDATETTNVTYVLQKWWKKQKQKVITMKIRELRGAGGKNCSCQKKLFCAFLFFKMFEAVLCDVFVLQASNVTAEIARRFLHCCMSGNQGGLCVRPSWQHELQQSIQSLHETKMWTTTDARSIVNKQQSPCTNAKSDRLMISCPACIQCKDRKPSTWLVFLQSQKFKALRLWFSSVWHQCNVHVWQIEQIKKKIGCQKTCNQ